MPQCLRCGAELQVNEEGVAPVLCDRCAGVATSRARRGMSTGTMRDYPATTLLTGINIAVFVGMVLSGGSLMNFNSQDLIRWGGNSGPLTLNGEYWRLITTGFVHSGLIHLGFNMWCLWSLGQLSEKLFGSWITAAVYLLTGVGGAMLSVFWNPARLEIGASGAIFGIAGAVLSGIRFGHVSLSSGQKRSITSSLIFFAGFNLFIGLSPGIDNMCHLGGFISGLIFGVPLATANSSGKKSFEWMTILLAALVLAGVGSRAVAVKAPEVRVVAAKIIMQLRHDYPTAIGLLEKATAENPEDANAYAMLGYAYQKSEQPDRALVAFKKALSLQPTSEDLQNIVKELEGNADGDGRAPK